MQIGDWFGGLTAGNAHAFLEALLSVEVRCSIDLQGPFVVSVDC